MLEAQSGTCSELPQSQEAPQGGLCAGAMAWAHGRGGGGGGKRGGAYCLSGGTYLLTTVYSVYYVGTNGCLRSPEKPTVRSPLSLGPGTLNSGATGLLATGDWTLERLGGRQGFLFWWAEESGAHRPLGPWSRPADHKLAVPAGLDLGGCAEGKRD